LEKTAMDYLQLIEIINTREFTDEAEFDKLILDYTIGKGVKLEIAIANRHLKIKKEKEKKLQEECKEMMKKIDAHILENSLYLDDLDEKYKVKYRGRYHYENPKRSPRNGIHQLDFGFHTH